MRFQDGFLRYTAGCNLITGIVGLDGDRLALRDGAHTAVLCEGARGADEAWLEAFMQARPAWRLEGMELTLTEPNAALRLLDRSVAEPNRPLEGTNWLLRSVTFHGATTLLAADKQPFVRFRAGRFFGGTTCNDFSGDVAGGAGAFDLTGLQVGPVPCTEPMATVERGLLALFVGPAQLDLTGDELVLSKDDGSAGRFVAQADGY